MNPKSKVDHLKRLCLASGWFAASLQHQEKPLDLKQLADFLEIPIRSARRLTNELVKLNVIWRDYGDVLRDENGIVEGREKSRFQFGVAAKPIESPNGQQEANFVKKAKNDLCKRPIYAERSASVDKVNKHGMTSSYMNSYKYIYKGRYQDLVLEEVKSKPEFQKMLKQNLIWIKQNIPNMDLKNAPIVGKCFKNLSLKSNATADQDWFDLAF